MKFMVLKKRKIVLCLICFIMILIFILLFSNLQKRHLSTTNLRMGGKFYKQYNSELDEIEVSKTTTEKRDVEKYFRPSKLHILNDREIKYDLFSKFYDKEPNEISLPKDLLKTPEDTIINYYTLLREAVNYEDKKGGGCGTIGDGKTPYPIVYNFFTSAYQKKVNYQKYLESFKNILHINLIKLRKIPSDQEHPNDLRYFVEIETIEGSDKNTTYFAYYYGYVYISKEGNVYKISDSEFYGEDFLCAPYHGWGHNAEAVVDIQYKDWCNLVKERYKTQQDGYVKRIYFKGTNGNDYLFVFFQLTNDTDILIAQYKKNANGKWEQIRIDPHKCLEKKKLK